MNYVRSFDHGLAGKYAKVFNLIRPNSSILELGCNSGYFSEYLMKAGHSVIGFDNNVNAIAQAISKGIDAKILDLDSDLPSEIRGRKFDVILCMDILEHLSNPVSLLISLREMMRDGGCIIATGPNVAYWAIRLMLLRGKWNYQEAGIMDSTHLRFYDRLNWVKLFCSAGFKSACIETAESMLPFENSLKKNRLVFSIFHGLCISLFPNLVTTVFTIKAQ